MKAMTFKAAYALRLMWGEMGDWSATAKVGQRYATALAKPLPYEHEASLREQLLEARHAHGLQLVQAFRKDFPEIDLDNVWKEIGLKREELPSISHLPMPVLKRFIDASAWGYSKEGTGQKGRFVVERIGTVLNMPQADVWAAISTVSVSAVCPVCKLQANVVSPCASLSSYKHATRFECEHCGHVDTLGRGSYREDDRFFGGRLTCPCRHCRGDRERLGREAADELVKAAALDVKAIHQAAKAYDWMGKYRSGDFFDDEGKYPKGPRTVVFESILEKVEQAGGLKMLNGEGFARLADEASRVAWDHVGDPWESRWLMLEAGVKHGWLELLGVEVPPLQRGGAELARQSLSAALTLFGFKLNGELASIDQVIEQVRAGAADGFRQLTRMRSGYSTIRAPAMFELVFDPTCGARSRVLASQESGLFETTGQMAPDDEAAGGASRGDGRGKAVGSSRREGAVSAGGTPEEGMVRKPSIPGMGFKSHLASHEQLLVQAKRALPGFIEAALQSADKAVLGALDLGADLVGECSEALAMRIGRRSSEVSLELQREVLRQAAEEQGTLRQAKMVLGKTLMSPVKKSSGDAMEVAGMRADFELSFEAAAFVVRLYQNERVKPREQARTVADVVSVMASVHDFRVSGAVFGEGFRVGQAVDEIEDLLLATKAHYNATRRLQEGLLQDRKHVGLAIFVTSSETLFELLSDQYDGVLMGIDGLVVKYQLRGLHSKLRHLVIEA